MAKVTLYLDEDTAERVKEAARRAGVSRSQWVTELVRQRTASDWPEAVANLAGAWSPLASKERLRRGTGRDSRRERF